MKVKFLELQPLEWFLNSGISLSYIIHILFNLYGVVEIQNGINTLIRFLLFTNWSYEWIRKKRIDGSLDKSEWLWLPSKKKKITNVYVQVSKYIQLGTSFIYFSYYSII